MGTLPVRETPSGGGLVSRDVQRPGQRFLGGDGCRTGTLARCPGRPRTRPQSYFTTPRSVRRNGQECPLDGWGRCGLLDFDQSVGGS